MKNTKIFLIAALLGSVMAGCQTEIEVEPVERPVVKQTVMLTVQASKGVDTKALIYDSDNNKWNAVWADNEKVDVYVAGVTAPQGRLTASTTVVGESVATLSGEIKVENLNEGENILTLLFPGREDNKWTYEGQDGTTPDGDMASLFDYAMATLTVNYDSGSGTLTPSGSAAFANQQSIFRFGFNMAMSSFTVYSAQNQLVTSRAFDGSDWVSTTGPLVVTPGNTEDKIYFVSIRNENITVDDRLYFSYIGDGNALYEGSQKIKTDHLGNGKFLGATVNMAQKTLEQASGTISNATDVL